MYTLKWLFILFIKSCLLQICAFLIFYIAVVSNDIFPWWRGNNWAMHHWKKWLVIHASVHVLGAKSIFISTIKGSCLLGKENPIEGNCWVKKIQREKLLGQVNPDIVELLGLANPNIGELLRSVNPSIGELLGCVNPSIG